MAASSRTIVLASRSPRRRALAEAEGWVVRFVDPPEEAEEAEGRRHTGETVEAFVVRLALAKARAIVHEVHEGLLVTCDTVGEIDGEVLGKPAGIDEARRMLRLLSGRRHRVVTGTCVWPRPAGDPIFTATESRLFMEPLSDEDLEAYLESGLWRGKAGACGFQDEAIPLRLEAGSGSNVVGLPVETLREIFSRLAD